MTWKGIHPIVELLDETYKNGVRLAKKAFQKIEKGFERDESLPKYSVKIQPQSG